MADSPPGIPGKLTARLGSPLGEAVYVFCSSAMAIAISGLLAHGLHHPLLFPSLGPTLYLFFTKPTAPESSPRDTLLGHGVAIAAGYLAVLLLGLEHTPSVLEAGVNLPRIGAAALSVAVTGAVLLLLKARHPPAGATTLLVSLGMLQEPAQLLFVFLGVAFLTVIGWSINRLCGIPVPLWPPQEKAEQKT